MGKKTIASRKVGRDSTVQHSTPVWKVVLLYQGAKCSSEPGQPPPERVGVLKTGSESEVVSG